MVLDPIPQSLPVHFFGSRPQPPTSQRCKTCQRHDDATSVEDTTMQRVTYIKRHLSLTHRPPPGSSDVSRDVCLSKTQRCKTRQRHNETSVSDTSLTSSDVSRDICLSMCQRHNDARRVKDTTMQRLSKTQRCNV